MSPVLSPDIVDAILDIIRIGDRANESVFRALALPAFSTLAMPRPSKALLKCSLVCRAWLSRSRARTFHDLHILTPLDNVFRQPPNILHTHGFHDSVFDSLLAHPLCTFRPFVRVLKFGVLHSQVSQFVDKASWFRLLSSVDTLDVRVPFSMLTSDQWVTARDAVFGGGITSLHIQHSSFGTVEQIVEVVSRCSNLETLRLAHLGLGSDLHYNLERYIAAANATADHDVAGPGFPAPSPRLRRVQLSGVVAMNATLLRWLDTISIPEVVLDGIVAESSAHVVQFLRAIGPTVVSLGLGFDDGLRTNRHTYTQDSATSTLTTASPWQAALQTMHALQLLEIFVDNSIQRNRPESVLEKFGATIPSNSESDAIPKKIVLHLSISDVEDLAAFNWARILSALNRPFFAGFERLEVAVMMDMMTGVVERWLMANVGPRMRVGVEIRCKGSYEQ